VGRQTGRSVSLMHDDHPSDLVRRAVVLVVAQLGCDSLAALETLQDVAVATDEPLDEVAADVLDGAVRFGP
jgi:AmiR/NasT family two-component response regulator